MATKPITITLPIEVLRFVESRQHNERERSLIITRFLRRYEIIAATYYDSLLNLFTDEEWGFFIYEVQSAGYTSWDMRTFEGLLGSVIYTMQHRGVNARTKGIYAKIIHKLEKLSIPEKVVLMEVIDEIIRQNGGSTVRINENIVMPSMEGISSPVQEKTRKKKRADSIRKPQKTT